MRCRALLVLVSAVAAACSVDPGETTAGVATKFDVAPFEPPQPARASAHASDTTSEMNLNFIEDTTAASARC